MSGCLCWCIVLLHWFSVTPVQSEAYNSYSTGNSYQNPNYDQHGYERPSYGVSNRGGYHVGTSGNSYGYNTNQQSYSSDRNSQNHYNGPDNHQRERYNSYHTNSSPNLSYGQLGRSYGRTSTNQRHSHSPSSFSSSQFSPSHLSPSHHSSSYHSPSHRAPSYSSSSYNSPSHNSPSHRSPSHSSSSYHSPSHRSPSYHSPSYGSSSHHSPSHHSSHSDTSHDSYNRLPPSHRSPSHPSSSHHSSSSYESGPSHRSPSSHWYRPVSAYRSHYRPRTQKRNGYYQASYDLGADNYYNYIYPKVPQYDFSNSHDTSNHYSYRHRKIACYQCNYKPAQNTWRLVTVRKSVPDPHFPFRYVSVETRKYVKRQSVSAGWDKCQGAISRQTAQLHGVYQHATCQGNCYVRVDKNQMVYRGCYSGEWGVNPHTYGCSYQAGSLYCFCRGDRCNGFLAPNTYSDPYPLGYGSRDNSPYPADYDPGSSYNPYPDLPYISRRRYRRDASASLTQQGIEVYRRMLEPKTLHTNNITRHSDDSQLRRSCYACAGGHRCSQHFTHTRAAILNIKSADNCYGNCYLRLGNNNEVSRGCFSGETGINQHLIGCHVQEDATYCFCRGNNCNNFGVTMETPQNEAGATVERRDKNKLVRDTKTVNLDINVDLPMVLYYIEFPG